MSYETQNNQTDFDFALYRNAALAYTDSSFISGYARNAVSWAAANLLMKGNADGSFSPNENTTRAQVAAVFARMLENLE